MIYLVLLGVWFAVASGLALLYSYMWWLRERAQVREQRRLDLVHAARELASADVRYRVTGGSAHV